MALSYPSLAQLAASGNRSQRKDYGDEVPSDIDDTKPTPLFAGVGHTSGSNPEYDYAYGDYALTLADPEFPGAEESYCFPGQIIAQYDDIYYDVDVYVNGLLSDPIYRYVRQLQINTEDVIPEYTWVLVAVNKTEDGSFDYTMQVPVWL